MKIGNYQVEQQALSQYEKVEVRETYVEVERFEMTRFYYEDTINISDEGMEKLSEVEEEDYETKEERRRMELVESMLSFILGRPFKFDQLTELRKQARAEDKDDVSEVKAREKEETELEEVEKPEGNVIRTYGYRFRFVEKRQSYESEKMSFQSTGSVETEDGRKIDFEVNLNMSQEQYDASSIELNYFDPLVIDLDGKGVDFSDKKIKFDLDLNGEVDHINFLNEGSGFLALDRNQNGKIDDGSELFGPQTNSGFGELEAYDKDGNHWIDENDPIFNQLRIWTVNSEGEETLIGLKDADVGAIYLGDVATSYTMRNGDEDMAIIKGSSIYLRENGQAQMIHEIDMKL